MGLRGAAAEPQHEDQDAGRVEAVGAGCPQEGDSLTRAPNLALVLAHLGHVHQEGDVARQDLLTDGPVGSVAQYRGTLKRVAAPTSSPFSVAMNVRTCAGVSFVNGFLARCGSRYSLILDSYLMQVLCSRSGLTMYSSQ